MLSPVNLLSLAVCMNFLRGNISLDVTCYAIESLQKIPDVCRPVEGTWQSVLPVKG